MYSHVSALTAWLWVSCLSALTADTSTFQYLLPTFSSRRYTTHTIVFRISIYAGPLPLLIREKHRMTMSCSRRDPLLELPRKTQKLSKQRSLPVRLRHSIQLLPKHAYTTRCRQYWILRVGSLAHMSGVMLAASKQIRSMTSLLVNSGGEMISFHLVNEADCTQIVVITPGYNLFTPSMPL